ncbi:4-hydroxybenzoate polyprenyltransferase [Nonlabens sp. Hel1_33_55]|uniref:geranylgeranylglycerol-phosphate geranylgeranyltransferase n=1 Tax=Nonlabens sp. Hel1_33_55 TaxID=1336802 RepID=UPI000875C0BE|nr:geranylgeranylglycerol-phosphate geranylgeranyltransferase [Nonlabens sp. Hel1_33_55]SCY44095.1 4-hydroxybenzoate polyprenyltransferase [Nonlabens sp. Hel1_33_55]
MATSSTVAHRKSNTKLLTVKVLSLFSSVRLYNIGLIAIAQLFATIFIIAHNTPIKEILTDYKLWLIIVASAAAIAGGYIINNFYDREKDLINRPQKTILENQVKQSTLWTVYFTLNGAAFIMGMIVSWRAGLFYALYITAMWFYSHKIKKVLFVGNLMAAALAITPFFVLFMYYKNFYPVILVHGLFLFLIIGMRELIKDLENLRGDLAQNYQTLPVVLGERTSKKFYTALTIITFLPVTALILIFETGYMDYYFAFITGALLVCLPLLWSSRRKREYLLIHFILKIIIVAGVFSILLIDLPAILDRIQTFL